ncbi:AlpA family transcriptional regulator [Pantoea allii]|jgi:prophage regulatory protein|uniref:AlpA family transcriptional regulator n=1 Tax=Pantoea allii TaxID=574096 RepID=A0ABS6VE79_9GAMM|nr:AlpA family transcriptional regulator [Pantoea allii]MBW1214340.1 AlpA family transcriptional regulator [Pantoea allii]MBW1257622.1 AlpA family transcriptional regulator [Pantoea allii]MBW1266633.1 AlpA family transcriptional regulator [Pantoea allii]MBW1288784.1 AlpA family transcriptional regulator [Pantoea allii]
MNISNKKLIRLSAVINKTGYSKSWIYKLIRIKQFPQPIKIGSRAVAFIEGEIDEWIEVLISKSRNETI